MESDRRKSDAAPRARLQRLGARGAGSGSAEVAIVGAGPAGVAAAVQLARSGYRPLVFERESVGGLLRTAWFVENLVGFPQGIAGPALVRLLAEQLRASGAELVMEEVTLLDRARGFFRLVTREREVRPRAVIVASGTRPSSDEGIAVQKEVRGSVFREADALWCVAGAAIAVVGAGDAAFDYAIGLAESNDVVVLGRGAAPGCLPVLEARAREHERVDVRMSTRVTAVSSAGDGRLLLSCVRGEADDSELVADYVVLALGREPDDGFLSESVRRGAAELERRDELLFAGDVRSGVFRQSSIASGQGVHAAMRVARMLGERAGP